MTNDELIAGLEQIKNLLVSVATGGPRINDVEQRYHQTFAMVAAELARRHIENPITFGSLWDWYGRWSSGDLPSYQSRREFIGAMVNPVINLVRTGHQELPEPTGWQRVDRCVGELRDRLASSSTEEQYQAVGLLGREALISLAQAVYVADRHPSLDGTQPSQTDGKRMLEAFIGVEMTGGANEEHDALPISALEFAVALQHRRTASFRDAAMCAEATTAVVNLVAIVAGRRDPQ